MCSFFFEVNLRKPSMKVICTLLWWTTYPPVPLKPTATQATARVAQRKQHFSNKTHPGLYQEKEKVHFLTCFQPQKFSDPRNLLIGYVNSPAKFTSAFSTAFSGSSCVVRGRMSYRTEDFPGENSRNNTRFIEWEGQMGKDSKQWNCPYQRISEVWSAKRFTI